MIADIARKIVPQDLRQKIGCWMLNQTSKSYPILQSYLWLLHGQTLKGLKLLPNGKASYEYMEFKIIAPRDGIGSFLEVFQDEVYDKEVRPTEGDVVIDVGAYVGMFTVKASRCIGSKGMVIAIEPDQINYNYLTLNTGPMLNVSRIKALLWSESGIRKLNISKASACHSTVYPQGGKYKRMMAHTLDGIIEKINPPRVDFIKIDAEGAELQVLKGAERILKRYKPDLSIASYHTLPDGTPEIPVLKEYLESIGYKVKLDKGLRRYIYAQFIKAI